MYKVFWYWFVAMIEGSVTVKTRIVLILNVLAGLWKICRFRRW